MCTQDELYRLGQKVDHLQQLNYQTTPFSDLVLNIEEIETLFTYVKDLLGDDIDSSIVFSYTRAIENDIRINDEFTPLYWVAKDLSISGSFAIFRKLRNIIEHRYLRVVEHTTITLEKELGDMDKMEYCISFSDLQQQALEILRLIRALLFYVIFAFHCCYLKTIQLCEKEHKAFIPLAISFYDDEWKN